MSRTMVVQVGEYVGRWRGGSHVAVWRATRADDHVPDMMITLPESLNRSRATEDDIKRVVQEWLTEQQEPLIPFVSDGRNPGDMHEPKPYTGDLEWSDHLHPYID